MTLHDSLTTLELATTAAAAASALVGLYIGYQAYRGLRRHDSAPMRYLSIGMVLLFGVTYVTAFAGNALLQVGSVPLVYQDYFRLVVRLIQLSGLLCIAYSLYLTRADARPAGPAVEADD
jgi:4-amino-4-deoxy-L-arabinose transferase-like glycosyltransferase